MEKQIIRKTIIRILFKVLPKKTFCYIMGFKLKIEPMFSNEGLSKHTWVLCSCHPLDSITWHWAIYMDTPKLSLKWILNPRFRLCTQKIYRK